MKATFSIPPAPAPVDRETAVHACAPQTHRDLNSLRATFRVEDVTEDEDKRHEALVLVARLYAQFASQPMEPEAVYEELCNDAYHQHGLARTILLTGYNPNKDRTETLGTVRFVLGRPFDQNPDLPPLEAMHLIRPACPWADFRYLQFDLERAFEYGRLAVLPDCREGYGGALNYHLHVFQDLVEGAYDIAAEQFGKSQAWAIMPARVVRALEKATISSTRVPGMRLKLRENAALFSRYARYWLHSDPGFYRVHVRPASERSSVPAGAALNRAA